MKKIKEIDLEIVNSKTLNELSVANLHAYYTVHYTPIKEMCVARNSVFGTPQADLIEELIDLKIAEMNVWLDKELELVRTPKKSAPKLSQTVYAKRMRAMRKNETKKQKRVRLDKRNASMKKWNAFQKRINGRK